MKQFLLVAVLLLIGTNVQAAEVKTECTKDTAVASVDGMVCDFCVQSITKVLKKNPDVKDVIVDLDTKTVTVNPQAGKTVSDDVIAKAIDYAGYKMVKIEHGCGA